MASNFENARLYQAALEERRFIRERAPEELIASEAVEALEHIDNEVDRSHAIMMTGLFT